MIAPKETYQLIGELFDKISPTIKVDSIANGTPEDNALVGHYTIFTCNTKWLTLKREIIIGDYKYTVADFKVNEYIVLKEQTENTAPTATDFDIYAPNYVYGTVLAVNTEETGKHSYEKFPAMFLNEVTEETYNLDALSSKDRDSDCDLFFFVNTESNEWDTQKHHEYAIAPMRNLMFEFIEVLKKDKLINQEELTSGLVKNFAKLGTYAKTKGMTSNFINDNLSGCHLNITIPFVKQNCVC